MTKSEGKARIDAIRVVELTLATRVTLPGAGVEAKFVLMNSETQERFGSGTFSTWSDETSKRFNELLASMERDIASAVFEEVPTTDGVEVEAPAPADEVPSL